AVWFFDPASPYFGWAKGGYANAMLNRLFVSGPKTLLTNVALGRLPGVALVALLWSWGTRRTRGVIVPGLWLASLLFMFDFMTISFKAYRPLPLLARYMYPLLLPSVVCISGWLAAVFSPADSTASGGQHKSPPQWLV